MARKYHQIRFGRYVRNEQCICGSGKKYKFCCFRQRARKPRVQTHKVREVRGVSTTNPEG